MSNREKRHAGRRTVTDRYTAGRHRKAADNRSRIAQRALGTVIAAMANAQLDAVDAQLDEIERVVQVAENSKLVQSLSTAVEIGYMDSGEFEYPINTASGNAQLTTEAKGPWVSGQITKYWGAKDPIYALSNQSSP